MIYGSWDINCSREIFFLSSWVIFVIWYVTDVTVIFHFGHFFALSPPNSPKNENFKKIKKTSGDIIILHKCTRTHDRMLLFLRYGVWRMFFFFHIGLFFPFPLPPNSPKNKNFKKMKEKKHLEISFYTHVYTKNYD